MELISLKAACDAIFKEYDGYPYGERARGLNNAAGIILDEVPTIPAVPLDKLCEWLSSMDKMDCKICKTTVGICKAEDSMNICHSKERWKKILLKWMEEQDNGNYNGR